VARIGGAGDITPMSRRAGFLLFAIVTAIAVLATPAQGMDLSRLVAPPSVCSSQGDLRDPEEVQEQAMLCMTNFARRQMGLPGFDLVPALYRAAADRSRDILRCDSFSHEACGREPTYWMQRVGYLDSRCWKAGENIAWGSDEYGTVRSIFVAWLRSPGHRANILGRFREIGIGLRLGTLEGHEGAHVWTQDFGTRC
jgi:uncharacterized protein YkwD